MSNTSSRHDRDGQGDTSGHPSAWLVFSLVFSLGVPLLYTLGDLLGLPLFTYHPGSDRFDWGWSAPRKDEGPAMYWYGWLSMALLGSTALGALSAWLLPSAKLGRAVHLAWLVPVLLTPLMVYSLKYYWKW
jgi:hypothetical protein